MNTSKPLSSPPRVLLIDDDRDVHQAAAVLLDRAGIAMTSVANPEEAHSALELEPADAILLDLNFTRGRTNGDEGFAALGRLLRDDPDAAVVVITGHSGIRIAVAAMQAGAIDFVMKPWRNEELLQRVRAAIAHRREREEVATRNREGCATTDPIRVLGGSDGIDQVRDLIRRVGPTNANVLVRGPAGSGRTLVAQAIHKASTRAASEIITLEARAAAEPRDETAGLDLERAASGILLVRHVDQLDELAQARLLLRLPAQARVVATATATEPLTPALLARIGTIEIAMPPLAERSGDALLLARHFARAAEMRHQRSIPGFTPEAEAAIASAHWADDVRGLAQAVERAVILSDGGPIDRRDLGLDVARKTADASSQAPILHLRQSERALIDAALKRHSFNVSFAAQELGLSRAALYRRMAKYGI